MQRNPARERTEQRCGEIVTPRQSRSRPAKKDTKRWCGGKVGLQHQFKRAAVHEMWREDKQQFSTGAGTVMICQRCGKKNWSTYQNPRWMQRYLDRKGDRLELKHDS